LLVSAGLEKPTAFMPNIRGMAVADALRVLAPFGVNAVANPVEVPGAALDTVLEQHPQPDTLLYAGQVVTYDVKSSGSLPLEETRHQGEVRHVMPYDWFERDVRVEVVDPAGNRQVRWSKPPLFDERARATYVRGSALRVPVSYTGEARVEIFVDGQQVAAYQLRGGADPVPTNP
jgi:hypothetical protein